MDKKHNGDLKPPSQELFSQAGNVNFRSDSGMTIASRWNQLLDSNFPEQYLDHSPHEYKFDGVITAFFKLDCDSPRYSCFLRCVIGRRIASLNNGILALVPTTLRPGDHICLIFQSMIPCIFLAQQGWTCIEQVCKQHYRRFP